MRNLRMVILPLIALSLGGCASAIDGDFRDLARPIYFDSAETISWLADNDSPLLEGVVAHNEVLAARIDGAFCDIARPMYLDTAETINWLADNDSPFLEGVVAHNEVTALCRR